MSAGKFVISSHCQDGGCVGVAVTEDEVLVRDEKNPDAGQLAMPPTAWAAFLDGIRVNRFG